MTPDDLLATLRDIHLPDSAAGIDYPLLAPQPFMVLGVLVAGVAVLRWWYRQAWRRDARRRLGEILRTTTGVRRRDALVDLYCRVGAHRRPATPIASVFQPPERATSHQIDDLTAEIRRMIQ